jgi:hypothetical protein
MLIESTQPELVTMENILERTAFSLVTASSTKNESQKYGNIFTAARPQSQCSKNGSRFWDAPMAYQSWNAWRPPTISLEGGYMTQTGVAYACMLSLYQI